MIDRVMNGRRFWQAGLWAGLAAALINIAIYLVMTRTGGYTWSALIVLSILIASLLPNFLAALLYFVLSRVTKWARVILTAAVVIFVAISILPHLGIGPPPSPALAALPAGFDLMTVPLHLVFGLTAVLLMPWLADKKPV